MSERLGWTLFMAAGVVVLVLLGLHMVTMHLDDLISVNNPAGGSAVDWANVVGRARAVSTAVGYVLLLGAALFHGLYGARNVLFDGFVLGEEELGPAGAAELHFLVDDRLAERTFFEGHRLLPYRCRSVVGDRGVGVGWEAWIRTKIP